jgi:hypothetical protein
MNCTACEMLTTVRCLTNVANVNITYCEAIENIDDLGENITSLKINGSIKIKQFYDEGNYATSLKNIKKIDITFNENSLYRRLKYKDNW